MIGRGVSEYDQDILDALKTKYSDTIKIDLDILSEPCIFLRYKGPWEMVYKLSANGEYVRPLNFYCEQIDNAISEFMKSRDDIIRRNKLNELKAIEDNKKFENQRDKFKNVGFKDNLPSE